MSLKPFTKYTRKEISTIIILSLTVGALGWWLPGRVNVVVSDSLSHRVFLIFSAPAKIKIGDYLVFKYDNGHRYLDRFILKSLSDHNMLTKQVGCTPGDTLTVDDERRFSCNGNPLGQALRTDSRGDVLPLFVFNGVVPQGRYFMIGSNPRSFDSKYFGFVKKNEIFYKAYPIW
jgi:conjugal transfer pilin signal peptidase TrbI